MGLLPLELKLIIGILMIRMFFHDFNNTQSETDDMEKYIRYMILLGVNL